MSEQVCHHEHFKDAVWGPDMLGLAPIRWIYPPLGTPHLDLVEEVELCLVEFDGTNQVMWIQNDTLCKHVS